MPNLSMEDMSVLRFHNGDGPKPRNLPWGQTVASITANLERWGYAHRYGAKIFTTEAGRYMLWYDRTAA